MLGDIHIESVYGEEHDEVCRRRISRLHTQIVDDPRVEIVLLAHRFDLFHTGIAYSNKDKRMITFTDNEGIEVKDHTSYYRSQLAGTLDRIREKGKELIILKQVPMFDGAKDCDWEPRIKKLLGKERICNFDTAFINKWQQPSIDFIDEFAATYNVAVFDPVPFFNGPLHYGINLYRDSDHLNIYGKQFLVPHFVKVMDEIMADKKEKNMADTALLSANKPR